MGEFLYYLTIKPIWFLFEIIFRTIYEICENPGISIFSVSIVMNILVLPMYLKSDAMQDEERKKQKKMEYWVKQIRKTFKGDERFMILSEYYRQNDYQPYYVLKSSLSLLLQVPFFIAAYDFLSNLSLLKGTPFLMIKDLGQPDGLIPIGGMHINLLPILMTVINLSSAAIYTRKGTKKEKVQTTVFALVFLVLLYKSPAGLVFYWTLNNIFSLCKNIVMDLLGRIRKAPEVPVKEPEKIKDPESGRLWALSSVLLSIFTGLSIPLSVISASPMDFAETLKYSDPVRYALLAFALAAGFFLLWGAVIYFLGNAAFRKIWSRIIFCCSCLFIVNHMIFSGNFGIISYTLEYDKYPSYDFYSKVLNLLFLIQAVVVLLILFKKSSRLVYNALTILIVCEAIFSIYNAVTIEKEVRSSYLYARGDSDETIELADINNRILKFSRNGKNVVIMMLDRSIGAFIPYMLEEKPELAEEFSGFTFYPNTVSTGTETINASAGLFGGYEYILSESNKRDDELIMDKQNQALKLLPELFSQKGYHSTLCNLPYANMKGFRTGSVIFDDMENCDTYCVLSGEYADYMTEKEAACLSLEQQRRNFFFYSLFRSAPLFAQEKIYDNGDYLSITCNNIKAHFITSMVFLRLMPELTEVSDDSEGELIMMVNDAPHENTLLNPPDYEPDVSVRLYEMEDRTLPDGRVMKLSTRDKEGHYDANMATFLTIGKWLEHLKELGVYDNTRIIITADHGFALDQFSYLKFEDIPFDAESVNPVLMVKDFNADAAGIAEDDEFMTNADVPSIAMSGIIEDPVNPFTGNPVNTDRKYEGPIVIAGDKKDVEKETETVFDSEEIPWYSVHDSIFDAANWEVVRPASAAGN
ncbi:MAG: YidC/Oxa1 family membrane protein insertase [Lachnospiraceae bacterium]|nr:YidC/Oxa1 family membrane protein insertase [Lachnospiraceae bacterium]